MNSTSRASLLSVFFLCPGLILSVGSAHAITMANSQAVIDSVIFNPTGLSLAPAQDAISFPPGSPPSGVRTSSSAFSRFDVRDASGQIFDSNVNQAPGIVFLPTASAGAVPHAQGVASTTSAPTLFERASAFADSSSPSGNLALAEAFQNVRFIALESGVLSASGNFTFDQELSVDSPIELAQATSTAFLELVNVNLPVPNRIVTAEETFENVLSSPGSKPFEREGSLAVSLFFNEGDRGAFRLAVTNTASAGVIPEPSTFLLFGSGLAGLGVWRWRKTTGSKS